MKKVSQHIWGLLLIILAVCVITPLFVKKEGFTNLRHGILPNVIDKPILFDIFPTNTTLTNNNYEQNCGMQNTTPSNYLESNNKRYPTSPNNGTCSPADVCGMYSDKQVNIPQHKIPYPWDPNKTRVNLYYGHKFLYC